MNKPLPKIKRIKKQIDWTKPLAALQTEATCSGESAEDILWGSIYALVDAYDQNITREAYTNLVMGAARLIGVHSCAATLDSIKHYHDSGALDDALLERSIAGNLAHTNDTRRDVARQYQLVTECRSEEDPVQ